MHQTLTSQDYLVFFLRLSFWPFFFFFFLKWYVLKIYIKTRSSLGKSYNTHTLNIIFFRVDLFQNGYRVGSGFARSILGSSQYVFARESHRNTCFLNWTWLLPAFLKYAHEQLSLQTELFKLVSFCVRHVLGGRGNLMRYALDNNNKKKTVLCVPLRISQF